mgnify:CR=1 FL=1
MTESNERKTIRAVDLFLCLIGNRGAIERIAAAPGIVLAAAMLVLSAGIARNYDHLDLLRRGEWFVGPFVASLVTTSFVALWLWIGLRLGKAGRAGPQLLVFLNLVWLTAPCAWLYGIPVERYTDLVTATKWNIAFLAIVSLWRVALIVRSLVVLTAAPWPRVLALVLASAALEMAVGSFYKSLSLINIMGGVRLSPHEEILQRATSFTATASFWTFVAASVSLFFLRGEADRSLNRVPRLSAGAAPAVLAAICLLAWAGAAVPHHRQIANRDRLEAFVRKGDLEAAIRFAMSKTREDFPPIHYLPPVPGGYLYAPPSKLLDLLEALPADAPDWLREEWTGNTIEASKSFIRDTEGGYFRRVRERHPDLFRTFADYADELEGRNDLDYPERSWLEQFRQASAEGTEE